MDVHTALALLRPPAPDGPNGPPPVPPLRGRALRFILVDELIRRPHMTVAEMVTALVEHHGFDLGDGRASKLISDALRWEVRRGRVVRLARGRYRFARTSRSTARRIANLAGRSRAWVVARRRLERTPAAPRPARPTADPTWIYHPGAPPWANLAWLRDV